MDTVAEADLPDDNRDFYQRLRVKISNWLEKHGDKYKYAEYLALAPDLLHLLCRLVIDKRISSKHRAQIGVAIAYFISPVDVIPEGVVGAGGYVDDIALAAYVLNNVINESNKEIADEHWVGDKDVLEVARRIIEVADDMVGSGAWNKIKKMLGDESADSDSGGADSNGKAST